MQKQKTKKFIDKKKSVSFQLVQRSQQDPLAADDTAPQNVLLPVYKGQRKHLNGGDCDSNFDDGISMVHMKDPGDHMMAWPEGIEETLQERMASIKAEMPKEVFPSKNEEAVGLLNRGNELSGLQLDLDPEVRETLEAMEDDVDVINPDADEEDDFDDFVTMANGGQDIEAMDDGELDNDEQDIDSDGLFSDPEEMQEEKMEKKSYYSMISHTTRTELLDLNEARFQRLYDEEYADGRHRPNTEYSDGYVNEEATKEMIYSEIDKMEQEREGWKYTPTDDQDVKQKTLHLYNSKLAESSSDTESEESESSDEKKDDDEKDEKPKHITYKNVMIPPSLKPKKSKIQVNPRTGVPTNVMGMNKLTTKALAEFNSNHEDDRDRADDLKSIRSRVSELSIRNPHETLEEKRQRKALFRDYKAERRAEKKANVMAHKETAQELQKVELNSKKNRLLRGLT